MLAQAWLAHSMFTNDLGLLYLSFLAIVQCVRQYISCVGLLGDQRLDMRRMCRSLMRRQRRDLCSQVGEGTVDRIDMVLGRGPGHREEAYP